MRRQRDRGSSSSNSTAPPYEQGACGSVFDRHQGVMTQTGPLFPPLLFVRATIRQKQTDGPLSFGARG